MEGGAAGGGGHGGGHGLGGEAQIKGTLTQGSRYVQYNVYGNLFEVSAKYVPPIRPVGRGACGIIWYAMRCICLHVYSTLSMYLDCFARSTIVAILLQIHYTTGSKFT
jgi:hypothetical protein